MIFSDLRQPSKKGFDYILYFCICLVIHTLQPINQNIMEYLNQITLQHALEYNATEEKFTYVCDTFDCNAHQAGKIATIEAYLLYLLSFNSDDYLNHLS